MNSDNTGLSEEPLMYLLLEPRGPRTQFTVFTANLDATLVAAVTCFDQLLGDLADSENVIERFRDFFTSRTRTQLFYSQRKGTV